MTAESQPYDSTLKSLIQTFATTLLPLFLPGVTFIESLNVELLRPTMRADRVFKVMYRNKFHILHLEFESSADDGDMAARLLTYFSIIHQEYKLPVISIIIYPFKVKMARSPLQIMSDDEELLTFHFKVLPLWELNAGEYVRNHALSMYPLLPTMQGVTDELLLQAMQEMVEYYQGDDALLARQFVWMSIMLRRAETIPQPQKTRIQERLLMFERLWDEDPVIQRIKAEAEAKGEAKGEARGEARGKAEGEAEAARDMVVVVVQARFPELAPLAQRKVQNITEVEPLRQIVRLITLAPDEATARWTLSSFAA